jgi:quercetin dioxygenase-like cupin family protein
MKAAAVAMALCCGAAAALATPPTGELHFVRYTLTIDPDAADRVQIGLPAALELDEDAALSHDTRNPSVFLFEDITYDSNADTGWHYHPGIVLSSVVDGQVEWYDADCVPHVHKQGDFFVERNRQVHFVRNNTGTSARLIQTFIIAKGLPYKISVVAPRCAAALGLE